ncbi:Sensory neuron membrane protein 1 [Hondaea fermentalgiana]|uniref:Sensory neuron membrane protein 1 n=1 Tax=Hondaea fermentalgiana TaxID=2315210 RepID=A0A2R5GWJ6_9STRA|nr:Sensory neuron membrane protein 1 [Hondaea fermentalgiana]|eukprot:GBG32781.1 Sensory neuron membrane protein 1 [Hondaea fermentalgiana]
MDETTSPRTLNEGLLAQEHEQEQGQEQAALERQHLNEAHEDEDLVDPLGPEETGDPSVVASRAWNQHRSRRCLLCASLGLLVSIALVAGLPTFITGLVHDGIRGNVVIDSEKADGFEQFRNRSRTGTTYMEFYLFNITNPHGVLQGEKPHLEELGPWIYTTYQIRSDFEWNASADTLAYREHSYYVFDPVETMIRTGGRFDTDKIEITTLNILFLAMDAVLGKFWWYEVTSHTIYKTDFNRLFTRKTVHELLTGYKDWVFGEIPIEFPGLYSNVTQDKDPHFLQKTIMRVGARNESEVYQLETFQGMQEVAIECPFGTNPLPGGHECSTPTYPCCASKKAKKVPIWSTEIVNGVWDRDANRVWGTVGEQFAPGLHPDETVIIFNDLISRALKFYCQDAEAVVYKGIQMYRYRPVPELFMNATERPANARYYQFGPRGFLGNLSMLEQGAPLQVSLPHFLEGDDSLIEGVEGLSPDRELHSMVIDIEPILGQTMVEHVRAQVVGQIRRVQWPHHRDVWFPHVRDGTYVPIGWFDQVSEITNEGVSEFRMLYIAHDIREGIYVVGTILSIAFAFPLLNAVRIHYFHEHHFVPVFATSATTQD